MRACVSKCCLKISRDSESNGGAVVPKEAVMAKWNKAKALLFLAAMSVYPVCAKAAVPLGQASPAMRDSGKDES